MIIKLLPRCVKVSKCAKLPDCFYKIITNILNDVTIHTSTVRETTQIAPQSEGKYVKCKQGGDTLSTFAVYTHYRYTLDWPVT